jgi:23S rRNA A1618 N6-methylase RlmF
MRRHVRSQFVLDLGPGGRIVPLMPAPEGLLRALADLLLEALGKEDKATASGLEICDAAEDHS